MATIQCSIWGGSGGDAFHGHFSKNRTGSAFYPYPLSLLLLFLAVAAAEDHYTLKRQQMIEQDIRGKRL